MYVHKLGKSGQEKSEQNRSDRSNRFARLRSNKGAETDKAAAIQ